ncbi:ATP-binding cassette domain-containing protein [Candidatus Woesearchaeota archaeon]|nr:ATP-binding cassette domain-containing protein [Candidatus Woesearchaeota archaeon]
MIQVRNLHHCYPDGTKSLNGASLRIKENEFVALIGRNGSGKTTLLLHLNGILEPKRGSVVVGGLELKKKNLGEIRNKVGIVFQNPDDMLFSATVFEDAAFGPRNQGLSEKETDERVKSALNRVGVFHLKDKNPHHLSLGQKKRVSIAAVLSMEPSVIVFDEPTSHLDPRGRKEIMELICSLNCTKIIATHELELLKYCNSVHVIDGGRIVHSGSGVGNEILKKYEII